MICPSYNLSKGRPKEWKPSPRKESENRVANLLAFSLAEIHEALVTFRPGSLKLNTSVLPMLCYSDASQRLPLLLQFKDAFGG